MLKFTNESPLDRVVRIILGLTIVGLGWFGIEDDLVAATFKIFGFFPLVTGILGWCPFYAILGYKSCKKRSSR